MAGCEGWERGVGQAPGDARCQPKKDVGNRKAKGQGGREKGRSRTLMQLAQGYFRSHLTFLRWHSTQARGRDDLDEVFSDEEADMARDRTGYSAEVGWTSGDLEKPTVLC